MIISVFIAAFALGQADMQAAEGAPPPDLVIKRLNINIRELAKVDNTQTALARAIGRDLTCLCGTCPKEPITDCRCGWAGQNKDALQHLVARGMNREQILAAYRESYGDKVLGMPPDEGWGRFVWAAPMAFVGLMLIAFFAVASRQMKKRRAATEAELSSQPEARQDVKSELSKELDELD